MFAPHHASRPQQLPARLRRSGSQVLAEPRRLRPRSDARHRARPRSQGKLELRYTNNSPDTLRFIWMQMEQNAFKDKSLNSFIFPQESRFGARGFEGGDIVEHFDQI